MQNNKEAGVVKLIVLIVVIVLILSYLGINIQRIAESEAGKANFGYIWGIVQQVWGWIVNLYEKYLSTYLNSVTKYLPFDVAK